MASTPEGKVKKEVRNLLDDLIARGEPLYYHQPVMNGMGKPTLDFVGCARGHYFSIETKAEGQGPTVRQQDTIAAIHKADGRVLVYDGSNPKMLRVWLSTLLRLS